ncbi:flagellar operon protein TIGR03826 [Alkalithermobacter thermoalcaliphilus JW-YL-7 = DSM 7308]|uniref:Flagellar operon protein TIGR03826 n=1 Tax=Alkalithermobacter thermoalcaliphilus JW-YL-7 = DSM 7308 TaxID=1121328 RepID=A0A150FN75_CLOPD|nr:yvyF, regulator of flagella formation [[Clostridium] paradoxum JW-YL-7 = DSM 7308]SHL05690.1 flagellar operon protein TIGR03826 [[Clostridium] paradoxum JW-YL-7 = DSM 7308]
MELINCSKCGRTFGSVNGEKYCSKCRDDDYDDFVKVRDYLYDNPKSTIKEVSEETGVSEKKILKFLKEERIEIAEEANAILSCERCGKSIKSGRYCETCKLALQKELETAAKSINTNKNKQTYHISKVKK